MRDALVPVADPVTGEEREQRCIRVVDAVLARQARALTVPEAKRAADRLIEHLDPPSPEGAHEGRYLHLSHLPGGSLRGTFACGPAQALAFEAVIAAGAAPSPGSAVDADGIDHPIADERTVAQRRMDALTDALTSTNAANSAHAATTGAGAGAGSPASATGADQRPGEGPEDASERDELGVPDEEEAEPAREGVAEIRHHPGVRSGPYPTAEILVTATLDQLAAALTLTRQAASAVDPPGLWPHPEPPDPPGRETAPGGGDHADDADHSGGLEGVEGFAHAQHGGPVHPATLVACSSRLRIVLLDRHGAVLHLGRGHRLARAEACPARPRHRLRHPRLPGARGTLRRPPRHPLGGRRGATDLHNLVLVCPRHHGEVDLDDTWEIEMIHGVPWVRPPSWAHRERPLLRNTTHRPHTGAA
ncbi:MAG: DUF222 domain-containing protein [Kineosporiaceae bacterium]